MDDLAGFVHDLGKILCLWGEPQWAVVGDTFPTGCAYSEKIVFNEFFAANPDSRNPRFQTKHGIYEEGIGLENVALSWGHDEYIYNVCKEYLPEEALYMLRYHSFYPWHREGEYDHLCNAADRRFLKWVQAFNPYDLYTKSHGKPDVQSPSTILRGPHREYFPREVALVAARNPR
jgi:inositol oxygenase